MRNSLPANTPLPRADDGSEHVSFIIDFGSGITAVCNPRAIEELTGLISSILPCDPDGLLDTLQMDSMKHIHRINCSLVLSFA